MKRHPLTRTVRTIRTHSHHRLLHPQTGYEQSHLELLPPSPGGPKAVEIFPLLHYRYGSTRRRLCPAHPKNDCRGTLVVVPLAPTTATPSALLSFQRRPTPWNVRLISVLSGSSPVGPELSLVALRSLVLQPHDDQC